MIDEQFSNSGELGRGVFDPFYGEYVENRIRNKIVTATNQPAAPTDARVEFSVYDDDRNLQYWNRLSDYGTDSGGFDLNVFQHIADAEVPDGGAYILRYNFFDSELGSPEGNRMYVQSVSGNRREIRVRPNPETPSSFRNSFNSFFSQQVRDTDPNDVQSGVDPLSRVANFGENEYFRVLNWSPVVETTAEGLVDFDGGNPRFRNAAVIRFESTLPADIEVGDELWIDFEVSRPYFDRFEIFRAEEPTAVSELAEPDFTIDANVSSERDSGFESFEEITDRDEFKTSRSFVESRMSGSESIDLNVDFTDFENFIHFSSAEERLKNFRFKVRQIHQFISELEDLQGTQSGGRRETLNRQIESLIGSFDIYEQWLFRSEDEDAYPKNTNGGLQDPDSVEVQQWFSDILDEASTYDDRNDSALRKQVPEFVREDPENDEFVLFVDMVGHWFDVNWIYIEHMEYFTDSTESAFEPESLSAGLSRVVAESMGLETFNGFDAEEFFDEIFDSDKIEEIFGTADIIEPTGGEVVDGKIDLTRFQAQQQVWRRLLSNLIRYYKTKGAPSSIHALTSIFGVPSESLVIRESGGTAVQGSERDDGNVKIEETTHNVSFFSSQSVQIPWDTNAQVTQPTGFDGIFDDFEDHAKAAETRFRTEYRGGRPLKVFELDGLAELRIERDELESTEGRFVLEVREADGTRVEAETELLPVFNGEWTNVLLQAREDAPFIDLFVQQRSPVGNIRFSEQASVNIGLQTAINFFTASTFHVGGKIQSPRFQEGVLFIGDFDQVNIWEDALAGEQFNLHTFAPKRYDWENEPVAEIEVENGVQRARSFSEEAEYFRRNLLFRLDFPTPQDLSVDTQIPNLADQPGTEDFEATAVGFQSESASPWQYNRYERLNFFKPVQVGATSFLNNKIRIEENTLNSRLRQNRSAESRQQEIISEDDRQLGVFFSPYTSANRDVVSEIGIESINGTLGNPNDQRRDDYHTLDGINELYWNKYDSRVDVQTYIRYVDQFYDALFDHVREAVPARASLVDGVVIEPTILERDRHKIPIGGVDVEDVDAEFPFEPDIDADVDTPFIDIWVADSAPGSQDGEDGDVWLVEDDPNLTLNNAKKPGLLFPRSDDPETNEGEDRDLWPSGRPGQNETDGPFNWQSFSFGLTPPEPDEGDDLELRGTPEGDTYPDIFVSTSAPSTSEGDDGDLYFRTDNRNPAGTNRKPELLFPRSDEPDDQEGENRDVWLRILDGDETDGPYIFEEVEFDTSDPTQSDGDNYDIWTTPIS